MYEQERQRVLRKPVNGEYILLGKVLGCDTEAARKRYKRGNKEAEDAMERIIDVREKSNEEHQKLIEEFSNSSENLTENK